MSEHQAATAGPRELMTLLARIEQRSRATGFTLPQAEVPEALWDGLVYSIGGVKVVTGMDEITEMLQYPPQATFVPGAKPWMVGLANVRGTLLPVIDLQVFLGAKPVLQSKAARMLVVRMHGLCAGLLVPSVQGMRHFSEQHRMTNARMNGALGRFVFDAFAIDGDIWPVVSLAALVTDSEFRVAAA